MIDRDRCLEKEERKAKTRQRYNVHVDPENYDYYPEIKSADYYDDDIPQRVAIYVRVSTDDVRQTTSFELQKKYYEDFVVKHPNWTLVDIYADEGISGTSLSKRDAFNQMIADAKAGKIDLIITKSVSRFARNVVDFIGIVRDLAERVPPVGVFFESEAIFSLNDDSQLALSFQATMAEEESHIRSRSMETSLRMRLDNGIPLTPKLLGFSHDADGHLVVNPEEAPTVRLAFFMYLYGYSTQQIAEAFNVLEKKSYLGNVKWTASGILQILRNERYCGDVLTRKTYTPNYRTHKSKKNRGQRPQSRYRNHHESIISRDDFIAVQQMLNNARYKNKSILPELRVIPDGLLKGFVTIHPRWAGFKEEEYLQASSSVYVKEEALDTHGKGIKVTVNAGDFDMRGFEITRAEFFDSKQHPSVRFGTRTLRFNSAVAQKFSGNSHVELLINPMTRKFAVRAVSKENRNAVQLSKSNQSGKHLSREIPTTAFKDILFSLFGWKKDYKYRILGKLYEKDGEIVYIFDADDAEIYVRRNTLEKDDYVNVTTNAGKMVRAFPKEWISAFGKSFYVHESFAPVVENQNKEGWKLKIQGELYESGSRLNVTSLEEIQEYIDREGSGIVLKEERGDAKLEETE